MNRIVAVAVLMLSLWLFLPGCAVPRVVVDSTSSKDQIKFLYQELGKADNAGIAKCKVDANGTLVSCKDQKITLK
ncbi:MAG: hypothetical protein WC889_10345 [Myxococcota bacterium]|jgi:hypothetical protein